MSEIQPNQNELEKIQNILELLFRFFPCVPKEIVKKALVEEISAAVKRGGNDDHMDAVAIVEHLKRRLRD